LPGTYDGRNAGQRTRNGAASGSFRTVKQLRYSVYLANFTFNAVIVCQYYGCTPCDVPGDAQVYGGQVLSTMLGSIIYANIVSWLVKPYYTSQKVDLAFPVHPLAVSPSLRLRGSLTHESLTERERRHECSAAAGEAFILTRRDLSSFLIREGDKLKVTIEVHNAGDGEATNVKVSDSEWDAQLFETKGDISASFDSIAAGATKAFSFSVVPSVPLNRFEQPEISVSYTTEGRTVSAQGPKEYLKVHSKDEMFRRKLLSVGIGLNRRALAHSAPWLSHSRALALSLALRASLVRQVGAWLTLGAVRDEETWIKTIVGTAGVVVLYALWSVLKGGAATIQTAKRNRVLREYGVKDE